MTTLRKAPGWALLVLALAVTILPSWAFKEQDFKKCADSAFCKRLRGAKGPPYAVIPSSVTVEGPQITAQLQNTDNAGASPFSLQLTAYRSMFRVRVVETGSERYELPDILMSTLPEADRAVAEPGASAATLTIDGVTVTLHFNPFKIEVPGVFELGSRELFHIEHKREMSDADADGMWEEPFKGFKDSKPRGPQAISVDMRFPSALHAYGIPEHATQLSLKPTAGPDVASEPYRLYNLDVFEYLADSPFGLYGSIPYLTAVSKDQAAGVFWHNAAEMYIDLEKSQSGIDVQWLAESGVVDVFVMLGPTPADLAEQYASLTGTAAMPQMFSIGYHQCRWNYRDEDDVKRVSAGFDEHQMPCDVIWLDIEHTDGKKYMTWDSNHFPDPIGMQKALSGVGRKMVTIVDPHVKRDAHYPLHTQASQNKYYVRNKDGADFDGWCWPGASSYLDVVDPNIRAWWASHFTTAAYAGSTKDLYIWNDMNEPSVFNGPEITMPKDALHMGSIEHRDIHNVYGLYYHQATADGLILRGSQESPPHGDRPFVLSRAFFSGTQRVGPVWTGDNTATWEHLKVSLPMLLSMNVAGLSNCGADVGGFFGNPETELLERWYQAAIFYPFFRAHAHLEAKRREPWLFGDEATARIRTALRERYALLPYIYTLFRAANETGAPVIRPMYYEYPSEESMFAVEHQLMLGPAILAAPVLDKGATHVGVHVPPGEVFYTHTGQKITRPSSGVFQYPVTMDVIPRLYRGGHIIPRRDRPRRSTKAQRRDPYTLLVVLDEQGNAQGRLYMDDGSSFGFLSGDYIDAELVFSAGVLSYKPRHVGVAWTLSFEKVIILGWPFVAPEATYTAVNPATGAEMDVTREVFGGSEAAVLVVRNPQTSVSESWSLTIGETSI